VFHFDDEVVTKTRCFACRPPSKLWASW